MRKCEREHAETDEHSALAVAARAQRPLLVRQPTPGARACERVRAIGNQTQHDVDQPQRQGLRPDRAPAARDELRQEREEEQRDLGIEKVDEEPFGKETARAARSGLVRGGRPASTSERPNPEEDEIRATATLTTVNPVDDATSTAESPTTAPST